MARSKKILTREESVAKKTWEEALDELVASYAPDDGFFKLCQEKVRAYVKDLELKVEELERELEQSYRDLSDLELQLPC
jgi:archaellum component FlaC